MRKNSVLAGALVAGIALAFSAGVCVPAGVKNDQLVGWVKNHVKALQPTPEEKRFDEIGWTGSIVEAERLAREHNRPVFLFTQDGRIATGRC
jgi:hypothetical protein